MLDLDLPKIKPQSGRRKEALDKCAQDAERIIGSMDAPIGSRITAQGIKDAARTAIEEEGNESCSCYDLHGFAPDPACPVHHKEAHSG